MKNTRDNWHRLLCALPFVFVASTQIRAQESPEQLLEEITVTATKRALSTQSVAISVSALSGEDLEERGAFEFFDFAPSIPNLSFGAATDGILSSRSISLRGISGTNTTGVYIDDTPITETIDPRILSLERIEVLRGPSGTLYGGRSLGGTIRYITRKPDFESFDGQVRAGLSNTTESEGSNSLLTGVVNVPLGSTAGAIFSVLSESQAGIYDRAIGPIADHLEQPATFTAAGATTVVEDVDAQNVLAYRASFLFQPMAGLAIAPRFTYQKTDLDGFPLSDIETDNFVQNRDINTPEGGEDEWSLFALNISYDFASGTFTSATSVFSRETFEFEGTGSFVNFLRAGPLSAELLGVRDGLQDAGLEYRPLASPIYQRLDFETTVQEFRFVSDLVGRMNFVAGFFYQQIQDDEYFQPRNFARGLGADFETLGRDWDFGDLVYTAARPSESEETGLFGELTYDFTESLSGTFGLRAYQTDFEFSNRLAGFAAGVPLADDVPLSTIAAVTGSQSGSDTIFKAAVAYQARPRLFFYGQIAQGFRIGGANRPVPEGLGCAEEVAALKLGGSSVKAYDSDELVSYEFGVKTDISTRTRINATAFVIDFEGIQQQVQLACGFQFTANFGTARSQGLELELTAQPLDTLSLGFTLGYTDAAFTQSVAAINAKGDPLQFVPEQTVAFNLEYVASEVFAGSELFVRADISSVGESLSQVNSEHRTREAYEQVGVRLGIRNQIYAAALSIKNLTNDIANLGDNRSLAAETPGRPRFVTSRPRTVGFDFSYRF